ncbi:MAG: hypothetical protein ACWGMZ_02015, partial [Thermoguttaceae bacterium]
MTAFDQAFIKAYQQKRKVVEPDAPTESTLPPSGDTAAGARPETQPQSPFSGIQPASVMTVLEKGAHRSARNTVAAKVSPSARGVKSEAENSRTSFVEQAHQPAKPSSKNKAAARSRKKKTSAPTIDVGELSSMVYRLDAAAETIPQSPKSKSFTSSSLGEKSQAADDPQTQRSGQGETATNKDPGAKHPGNLDPGPADSTKTHRFDPPAQACAAEKSSTKVVDSVKNTDSRTSKNAMHESEIAVEKNTTAMNFYPQPSIRVFQPMLQVDHFIWPKVCRRLETTAYVELERLGETLISAKQQGVKVVAFGSTQHGEGVTTLVLCAARQLMTRNVKTVLVDADLNDPQLGKSLGLLPQLG